MKVAIVVAVLVSVAFAAVVKRQATDDVPPELAVARAVVRPPPVTTHTLVEDTGTLRLPSGASLILNTIVDGFSCLGRIYGYYADPANNCQIFHVCVPALDEQGNEAPYIYSFFCGNQTVFDQENLVCAGADVALPCDQAQDFYSKNENFGKTDRPIERGPPAIAVAVA